VQHLLHKSQFDAVLGTRNHLTQVSRSEHFFVHRLQVTQAHTALFKPEPNKPEPSKAVTEDHVFVGVMCPKRFAKRAVTRNMIKRQIYALTREAPLAPAAYVVRLKAPFAKDQFKSASSDALKRAVRGELQQVLSTFLAKPAMPPAITLPPSTAAK
jgi:ribonuclease P protein component